MLTILIWFDRNIFYLIAKLRTFCCAKRYYCIYFPMTVLRYNLEAACTSSPSWKENSKSSISSTAFSWDKGSRILDAMHTYILIVYPCQQPPSTPTTHAPRSRPFLRYCPWLSYDSMSCVCLISDVIILYAAHNVYALEYLFDISLSLSELSCHEYLYVNNIKIPIFFPSLSLYIYISLSFLTNSDILYYVIFLFHNKTAITLSKKHSNIIII